ncbi:RNA processing factor 1 [Grosmannia clavigera kw1407]|uniref:RNA processing factor 1 n=1 Tax=Grosmannia clavigera (strain kw1407 / UAMH 11150) TaxID=655863 RepID=F0X869_GROCL|nr:RNA processing factor 1 [Grosmannia clavigera kw1407]EFX05963.1 RNA processing factor 1 [Grosmannia clavigera kw1407]
MGSKNKIQRQESWLNAKKEKGRTRIQERKARRREEDKNPQLRAERLAQNKPKTLEDKRIWPASEDDYARRKRRKVEEEAQTEVEEMEEDEAKKEEEEKSKPEAEVEGDVDSDDDLASFLGDDDDDEEEATPAAKKGAKEKAAPPTAEEKAARQDAMAAKYAELLKEPAPAEPRILITTSRHATIHKYAHTLVDLFPNSTYIPRSGHRFVHHEYSIREIAGYATNRGYTALMIVNEDLKKASGLDIALLPHGPMLHFSIQTWVDAKFLPNHGRSTGHSPEMIMNNFDTSLGKLVGGVLGRLFPPNPDLVGRQVVTLHNQRDYVFVRRHRYAVRDKRATERSVADKNGKTMAGVEDVKVALQEIGPRMTLKLRRVDKGLQRMSGQAFEWRGRMEKQRTLWQL